MIQPGSKLAHYEVVSALGKGGRGKVWRARDSKLGREVAIKTLPEEFAQDEERLARFEREAKLLASLNHPNIATIHGLEEDGGTRFLVLELVEGESVAEFLVAGPLPTESVLKIGRQIAEALEAAHGRGVTHRDLKPANIMVTPDGQVKVLDFGLAKALPVEEEADSSSVATVTQSFESREGTLVGTPAYMSPEQVRGQQTDKRADIWAFGCVLYELLTGTPPFRGPTLSDTVAKILQSQPDWTKLPVDIHPRVRELLDRCLEKDLRNRWHDIADARIDIERAMAHPGGDYQAAGTSSSTWKRPTLWMTVGVVLGAMLFAVVAWDVGVPGPPPVRRSTIVLADTTQLTFSEYMPLGVAQPSLALSADGSLLVYVVAEEGRSRLYLQSMNAFDATPLPGTEGAYAPFFSPNGQWVGFFSGSELKKISIQGDDPVNLGDANNPRGVVWGPDDWIFFTEQEGRRFSRISSEGGAPEVLGTAEGLAWPQMLSGNRLLFASGIIDLDTDVWTDLFQQTGRIQHTRYVETGHLIFSQGGTLMAQPFDLDRTEVLGPPVPILDGVRTERGGLAQFTVSSDGSLAYVSGVDQNISVFAWVDRRGNIAPLELPPRRYGTFALSPDGERLAAEVNGTNPDIYVYELGSSREIRLTLEAANRNPVWTPDGRRVTFASSRTGVWNMFVKVPGGGEVSPLAPNPNNQFPGSWSLDERFLALGQVDPGSPDQNLYVFSTESGDTQPFVETRYNEWGPSFSPDGKWIAYTSDESGRYEVYVKPFPPTEDRWQISSDGGEEPQWSAGGDELFYRNGREWVAVPIETEPRFAPGTPEFAFEGPFLNVLGFSYRLAPDGRFLVINETEQPPVTTINLVLNWFEELKELVAVP